MFISSSVCMHMPLMTGVGRRRILSTPGIVVCAVSFILFGIGMLVAMRGGRRRTLIIASAEKTFSWTEPHTFGVANGSSMFEQASAWAESNGLPLEVHQEEKRA